ncbi:MAG: hypothetical protein ABFC28_06345 [Rikenellaceae bacterium]
MNNVDTSALEQTIEKYPWFSLAHLELFKKVCELGEEQKLAYLNRTAAYVYSRERLFNISRKLQKADYQDVDTEKGIDTEENAGAVEKSVNEEITFEIETDPLHINEFPKLILTGGDYFCKNDFEEIRLDTSKPLDKFIVKKPSLLRSNPAIQHNDSQPAEEIEGGEKFDDSGFYTETLAKIYTEQCFYKRALEVYAKLILLYPEKSSYFAALVQELKSKHNQ